MILSITGTWRRGLKCIIRLGSIGIVLKVGGPLEYWETDADVNIAQIRMDGSNASSWEPPSAFVAVMLGCDMRSEHCHSVTGDYSGHP
jgi:hypothetical protein